MVFLFQLVSQAQIDQKKLDSLRRSIDSSANERMRWEDSFVKVQDSVYHTAISKIIKEKNPGQRQENEVQRQKILQGIVMALLAIIAVVVLLRRRKKSN